jgi:hypothetical protein
MGNIILDRSILGTKTMGNRNKKRQVKNKRKLLSNKQVADIIEEFTLTTHKFMKKRINTNKK